ncbi:MAG: hypothetical protein GX162_10370 [Firmicutes bacterium]|jgi:hypothetical protein|nr:hypothetical protein [Bacillota bacterium]
MAVDKPESKTNGGDHDDVQKYQAEVLDKIRSIHGTVGEIKATLAQTHRLTAEIHERMTKKGSS